MKQPFLLRIFLFGLLAWAGLHPSQAQVTNWLGGAASAPTDWFTPANWDNGVPTLSTDVVIQAGRPRNPVILSGAAQGRTLTLVASTSLILNGGTLELTGDFVNNGAYNSGGGTIILSGSTVQHIGGTRQTRIVNLTVGPAGASLVGDTEVRRMLILNGNLTTNGQPFLLSTDFNGGTFLTATVVNNGGVVVGNARVQRFIFGNNAGLGYRHYSSPVSGSTVADLAAGTFTPVVNPLFNTQGPSVTPFPTVFGYDQSRLASPGIPAASLFDRGWYSPAALTDPLVVGQGYAVNITRLPVVDFVGTLNTGPITLNLARNTTPAVSAAIAAGSGLHLIGNPYPASIDWSLVDATQRPGLDAAMYVFESSGQYTGAYRTYANGIGSSPLISTAQGFFVSVSDGQSSGSLTFEDADRVTDFFAQPGFYRGTADLRPQLELSLGLAGAPADQRDAAYLYQQAGATAGFDAELDARKINNPSGLDLAFTAGTESLAIDGLPVFTQATAIPLSVRVPAAGQYTLQASSLRNLPAGTSLTLTDTQTGQQVDLTQPGASLSVAATGAAHWATRFYLHWQPAAPLATRAGLNAASVTVFPNPSASGQGCTVLVPAVAGAASLQASLLNALGQQVYAAPAVALPASGTSLVLPIQGLAAGVYTLRLQAGAHFATKRVVVQ